MAKTQPKQPEETKPTGRRHPRGPLGPSAPEVSVFASFEDGAIAATPSDMTHRGRRTGLLVTDDATCVDRFSHADVVMVGERTPRLALLEAFFAVRGRPLEERIMLVAGSAALVEAALDDAWRVVSQVAPDEPAPYGISEWRSSRLKDSTSTTYTRD